MATIVTGRRVLLPDSSEPRPATITIDASGKITSLEEVWRARDPSDQHVNWVDARDLTVIPGLVECVTPRLNQPRSILG